MAPFFDSNGDPTISPYEVLGLPSNASETDIKKAYRTQMLQLHPDKLSPDLDEHEIAAITEKFHNVKDAYEFLIAPQYLTARRMYQAKMASRRAEYERREAFLRRAGGGASASGVHHASPPSYHARHSSYPVPPRDAEPNRSKSVPRATERVPQQRRTSGMGQPRYYKAHVGGGTGGGCAAYTHNNSGGGANRRSRDVHRDKEAFREKNGTTRRTAQKTSGGGNDRRNTTTTSGRRTERGRTATNDKCTDYNRARSEPRRHRREGGNSSGSSNEDERYGGSDNNIRKSSNNKSSSGSNGVRVKRRRAKSAPARCAYKKGKRQSSSDHAREEKEAEKSHPKEFYCPLTKRIMKDPVMDMDGNTYEREAIERWLRVQSSSPITNGYLSIEQLKPNKELKNKIYKATGKPRSKSVPRSRSKSRESSPSQESGRVLIDSYLREISKKSKLSVSLDGMGICAFSYRRLTFVIEVPITPNSGFMVYSSFDSLSDKGIAEKIVAWNKWLGAIGWGSRVSYSNVGNKGVFTLKGNEKDMIKCDVFQKTLEYFVEMSLKLHNLLHPTEAKSIDNVCLTRSPVCVA